MYHIPVFNLANPPPPPPQDNIYCLKRIAKIGAEQLKMDLHGVKEYLLLLPAKVRTAGLANT